MGSTLALTDPDGGISTEYSYAPFGVASVTGATNSNAFGYTGREDDGTGLYYYRARYYYPVMQRFISEDPIGFAGDDVNLYAYVLNDPANYSDPIGTVRIGRGLPWAELCRSNPAPVIGGRKEPSLLDWIGGRVGDAVRAFACEPSNLLPGPGMITGPSRGMLRAFSEQLARHGRRSLEKSLRTFEKRLAEHLDKLAEIEKAGGPPGSVQREIRNFQAQIDAIKRILESGQ